MSDSSKFIYMPASSLASRRIIEQSSYTTTPAQSPTDPTPPCGETVYKRSLDAQNIETVDLILQTEQHSDTKMFESPSRKISMLERNEKRKRNKSVHREGLGNGKKSVNEELDNSKLSIILKLGENPGLIK